MPRSKGDDHDRLHLGCHPSPSLTTMSPSSGHGRVGPLRRSLLPCSSSAPSRLERVLTTVLFTDITGATARLVALGDRRWREILTQHKMLVRYLHGKVLTLEARRHQIAHNISRRYEADAADGKGCRLREPCLQNTETPRETSAVLVETAKETLSQPMMAKIDTPEARTINGQRLAIVESVFGNIRVQKRLGRLAWRSRIKVEVQWRLDCIVHNIQKIVH